MKLYLVTLRGFSNYGKPQYKNHYVIAENSNLALEKVQNLLKKAGVGNDDEREFETIKLLAEDVSYPSCGTKLHL